MQGYNGTLFAYGPTGSGKTWTMFGPDLEDENKRGKEFDKDISKLNNYIKNIFDNTNSGIPFIFHIYYNIKFYLHDINMSFKNLVQ